MEGRLNHESPALKGANTYLTVVVRHPVARLVPQGDHAPCLTPAYSQIPSCFPSQPCHDTACGPHQDASTMVEHFMLLNSVATKTRVR